MSKSAAAGFDAVTTLRRSDFGISKSVPMVGRVRLAISMETHAAKARRRAGSEEISSDRE